MSVLFPTAWDGPSSAPVPSPQQGKKRKRPSGVQKEDEVDLKSVEINIEKLMKKMQQEDVKAAKEKKGKDLEKKGKEKERKEAGKEKKEKTGHGEKAKGPGGAKFEGKGQKPQGSQKAPNGQLNGKPPRAQAQKPHNNKPVQDSATRSNGSQPTKGEPGGKKDKQHKRRQSDASQHSGADASPTRTRSADEAQRSSETAPKLSKKEKKKLRQSEPSAPPTNPSPPVPSAPAVAHTGAQEMKLTPLQAKMKASLSGARFRWINEQLYTTSAASAHELMRSQPNLYSDYHAGFSSQLASWPTPPLEALTQLLVQGLPKHALIADLGSGPGTLAKKLVPQGRKVLSFDLRPDEWVIEANYCERIPLPGAEGLKSEGAIVDAAVCCLSLMGTDWVKGVREARRVLVNKGQFYVAEVTSRFTDVDAFVEVVEVVGFRLVRKDDKDTHFWLFVFEKVARDALGEEEWEDVQERAEGLLKPCEYKRR